MKGKGILLDENSDLLIKEKSLVIGDVIGQNQKNLILIEKTELKFTPMRGVGARRFLEDNTPDNLAREIRREFGLDGMKVNSVIMTNEGFNIDASYE
ncbi:hypothetical protein [Flavobacterium gilvum]|uniref:Uncharacterized protein n=1 Tax=Flavobacterium gilvum TaxID=1492737 RepID=A0AAC9I4K3_9FLAO|nr:hypothetical protein [Flavobacterium gilvum]AOW09525.1 hypothetical protein EM308_08435 [Flavobacterium gilvum]KFC60032.1 hypothetical protein FEM08_12110 [Flavobacterium gilvum]